MIIHNVEQNSPEWLDLRVGRPSASEFKKLVTSTGQPSKSMPDYAMSLAADAFAGKSLNGFEGNKWTELGHEVEPVARDWYSFDRDVEVEQVGFITDDEGEYGCSPDGLVGEDGLVEIKCLPKQHAKALMYYLKHKKPPPDYVPQCQGQLYICERKWVDLVFYHPDLPKLIIHVEPDEKVLDTLKTQLESCIAEKNRILTALRNM